MLRRNGAPFVQRAAQQNATAPSISIDDVSLPEGQAGTNSFVFTVTLSSPSSRRISVNFATADGSATVGDSDYVRTSGTLNFAPGEMTKTITVLVKGDTKPESNETFFVNLSRATNAVIADAQGVGTILNDDDGSGGGGCNPSTPCDPLPPPDSDPGY